MDHIEANNVVTIKSMETNRTPEVIGSVIGRLQDVLDICIPYMKNNMDVLDLGTKDCLFYDVLKEYEKIPTEVRESISLMGVDCCPEAIDVCHSKGYYVENADVQDLSVLYEYKFDFIFIIHTLEHVPNPKAVIEECKKILKPNGYIFVEVPIQSQIDAPEKWGHYHPFTSQQQVRDLFSEFEVITEDWQKTRSKSPWYRVLFQTGL